MLRARHFSTTISTLCNAKFRNRLQPSNLTTYKLVHHLRGDNTFILTMSLPDNVGASANRITRNTTRTSLAMAFSDCGPLRVTGASTPLYKGVIYTSVNVRSR